MQTTSTREGSGSAGGKTQGSESEARCRVRDLKLKAG